MGVVWGVANFTALLFFPGGNPEYIGIYVRVVRVSCVPFFPYTQEAPLKIILKIYSILEISGNFNVRGSLRFYS